MSIPESFKLFVTVKEAENVKPGTKSEYYAQFRYFHEWLNLNFPELECPCINSFRSVL